MCRSIMFVGILALVVVNLQSTSVSTAVALASELNKPNGNAVIASDLRLGGASVQLSAACAGSSLSGSNANARLTFDGAGVFTCAGTVNVLVDVVIGTSNIQNFFTSGAASSAKITLRGNTIFVEKSVEGTLFRSNVGVIDFNDVTVRNTPTQSVVSFGAGFFFTMGGNSPGSIFTFTKLRILGLNKTGQDTAVFDLSNTRASINFVGCEFSNFTVNGSTIDDGVAGKSGLSIKDSNFTGIKRTGSAAGGFLYIRGNGVEENVGNKIEILNTTFNDCSSSANGGAIYYVTKNKGTNLTFDLCTVVNCSSQKQGGFIFASHKGRVEFINCTFDHCTSKEKGGVLMAFNFSVQINTPGITVQASIFQYCRSNQSGGVFYYTGHEDYKSFDSRFTIVHCDFFYCGCAVDGGVGYFENSCKAKCNESVFYNCTATARGGAIKMQWSGMELANCTFSRCYARFGGACNFLMNVELFFYDCLLTHNSAEKFGGAVAFERRTLDGSGERLVFQMRKCYMTNNTVQDSDGYGLDVVFMEDADIKGEGVKYPSWNKTVNAAYTDGNFTGSYTSSVNNGRRVYVFYNGDMSYDPNKIEFLGQWVPVKKLLVSTNGTNSQDGCGYTPAMFKECRDIAYACSRLNIDFEYTVQVLNGVYYEKLITVQLNKKLTVLGYGRGDPFKDGGTRIIPQYDRFYSALFICHYPDSGLILNALSFEQSNPDFSLQIRSAVYLNTPDASGFLKVIDCCFYSPYPSVTLKGCLIYSMGHDVTVEDTTFDNFTTSAEHGGVIRFGRSKNNTGTGLSLTVFNTEFISCKINTDTGENGGGAVYVEGSAKTSFTLVRFEYCVGRAFVFDYGRSQDNSEHLFDKCVFVNNEAILVKAADTVNNYKGSALACLYVTKSTALVKVYLEHCYFGLNSVTKGGVTLKGHDAGFITSSTNADQTEDYWKKLIEYTWSAYDNENENFWDCYSDGEEYRVWTSSTSSSIMNYYENPRLTGILDYYYRPTPLRVSHTRVGFNGEYCGCDHVPCNTIAYTYSRAGVIKDNSTWPDFHELYVAPVVNNETATLRILSKGTGKERILRLLKKEGEFRTDVSKVTPSVVLDQNKVLVGLNGHTVNTVDGPVPVFVSMNDSVHKFFHIEGLLEILPSTESKNANKNDFHFIHNSSSGDRSLFYWDTDSPNPNILENVDISDARNASGSGIKGGALSQGLLTLVKGKVQLINVHIFSLLVDEDGSVVDVQGGELEFRNCEVGGGTSGHRITGSHNNSCVLRISAGKVNINSGRFANVYQAHAIVLGGDGELNILSCEFTNCVSDYNGSVIHANLKESGKLLITGCKITNSGSNAANSCGGAIYAELGVTGDLKFESGGTYGNNQFTGCFAASAPSSVGYGGAIFLYVEGIAKNFDFSNSITFSGSQATKGKSIYVHAKELREIIVKEKFAGLYVNDGITEAAVENNNLEDGDTSVSGRNELAGTLNETLASATHIPLVYFFFRYKGPVYVNNNNNEIASLYESGYDRFWCGRDILPCLTISEANTETEGTVSHHPGVTKFILVGIVKLYDLSMNDPTGVVPPATIMNRLVSNRYELPDPIALHTPLTIESSTVRRATLDLVGHNNGNTEMYTCTGALNLTGLDIHPTTWGGLVSLSSSAGSVPLLVVINCKISWTDTGSLGSCSVIKIVGGGLDIKNSSFSGIQWSTGSPVSATIPAGSSFNILNSNFSNCKGIVGNYNGGALNVVLSGKFTIEENYSSASETRFDDCDAGNAGLGGAIYLKLEDGADYKYVFGGKLYFTGTSTSKGKRIYVHCDELSRKIISREAFQYPQYVYKNVAYPSPTVPVCYGDILNHYYKQLLDGDLEGTRDPRSDEFTDTVDLKPYLVDFPCGEVYVKYDSPGKDYSACGSWEHPCKNIYKAISNAVDSGLLSFKVGVIEPTDTTFTAYDFEYPTNVYPTDPLGKIVSVNVTAINGLGTHENIDSHSTAVINAVANTTIEVPGRLIFSDFTITPKPASIGIFVKVTSGGFLNVTGSSFSSTPTFDTSAQVIVIESGGSAYFLEVSFTNIKSAGLTGSALLATVASGRSLYLIGCIFSNCITGEKSSGSAIHVTLNQYGIFSVSGTDAKQSLFENDGRNDYTGGTTPEPLPYTQASSNKQTHYGGGIYLKLGTNFNLDMAGSQPSYFEFVGNLEFSETNKNKASCGHNIFIDHESNKYEEVINRQTFDFLISKIEYARANPHLDLTVPGFDGFISGVCEDVTEFVSSSDPVYVRSDGLDSVPSGQTDIECSKTFPCLKVEKAIDVSGGTHSGSGTRSVNVRLISLSPGDGFDVDTTLAYTKDCSSPYITRPPGGNTHTDINAYSFKGIELQGTGTFKQENAKLVKLILKGGKVFIFTLKLSFENIEFPVTTDTGLLFNTPETSELSLINCVVSPEINSYTLSSGLFKILSKKFVFSSRIGNNTFTGTFENKPLIEVTTVAGGTYEFKNAPAPALFAGISGALSLAKITGSGNVIISNSTIASIAMSGGASIFEITASGGKVTITNMVFASATVTGGGAAVSTTGSVAIADSTFNGLGTAVKATVPNDGSTVSFTGSLTFGGFSQHIYLLADGKLQDVVNETSFNYNSLTSLLSAKDLNFYTDIIPVLKTLLGKSDKDDPTSSNDVSLYYYLLGKPTPVFASPDSSGLSVCGYYSHPCNTFGNAIKRGTPVSGVLTVHVVLEETAAKLLPLPNTLVDEHPDGDGSISEYILSGVVAFDCCGGGATVCSSCTSPNIPLTDAKATLSVPGGGSTAYLDVSTKLSLTLKYIKVKLSQGITANVFSFAASPGSTSRLTFDNVEIIGPGLTSSTSSASIISYLSPNQLSIVFSTFNNIKLDTGSVISIGGDFKNVAIEDSNFTQIASSGNGAAISTTPDSIKSLTIKRSDFIECKSTGGDGGALFVELTNGGAFTVEDGKFTSCSTVITPGNGGNGGAVYLKLGSGFNLFGNTSFVFKDSVSTPVLLFDLNTAVNGNNIFVDGSDGTDLSYVVSGTTFAFGNLNVKPNPSLSGTDCNDWMGYNRVGSDLKWLNRYLDDDCYLFNDGCPSPKCVVYFDTTGGVQCLDANLCPAGFEKEKGEDYCIEKDCSDRNPRSVTGVTINGVCGFVYIDPYNSTCGDGCFLTQGGTACTDACPEHSKKEDGSCKSLECVKQVVCPDGKISFEDTCVNDTCVSRSIAECPDTGECGVVVLNTKDVFGVANDPEDVCRSKRSSTYRNEDNHNEPQCGSGSDGNQCYLNATETGINKCIPNCDEDFSYVKDPASAFICVKKKCAERTEEDVEKANNTCGDDCYYFGNYGPASDKYTTTRNTTICMNDCPQFYYDKENNKKCELRDCTGRVYSSFACPQDEVCGSGNDDYPEDPRRLTCGPDCYFKNYSTSCDTDCDPDFFTKVAWEEKGTNGWGYCDLKLCPDREGNAHERNCQEYPDEECYDNQFDICTEEGVKEGSTHECVYFEKAKEVLVGGKSAEDIPGCGAGNRQNCKTVSYAVSRAEQSCNKAETRVPIVKVTADVIETARAGVQIDITGIELRSQSSVKKLTINMVYRASFVVGPYDKRTIVSNLIFNTFTIRDTNNYAPLFYTVGDAPLGSLTLNGVTVNYAVGSGLAGAPTFVDGGFTAWVAQFKGITVNFKKSVVNNRIVELPPSAASLSSFLSSPSYRLTRLDLSVMFDLDFSDDPEFETEFLDRFSPVIVSLASSTLATRSLSSFNKQSNVNTGVCAQVFPNPAVLLTSLNGTFEYSNFSYINTGAIKLVNSANVTLLGVAFFKNRIFNSPQQEELPSMRHNVYLSEDTSITVINLIAESSGSFFLQDGRDGDGLERIIVAKDGSDENNVITPFNELFTPIFTDSIITPSDDGGSFILTLRGGMFFPCDPILVLYRDGEELGKYKYADNEFSISGETSISVNVTVNAENYFEPVGEYKALLEYEPHQRSALYTYNTVYGIPPQKAKANLQPLWWILVALGILILLLLALVIFLYIRMKLKQKELEQDAAEARIRAQVRRDQQINKQRADQRKLQEKKTVKEPVKKADRIFANDINSNEDSFGAWEAGADEWVVDARRCEHPFGVVQCDRRRTLFALYTELSAQALNTSSPQETFQSMLPQKLRNPMGPMLGLAQLMNRLYQENPNVPVDHISPHTLLVSTKGSLALVLKKDAVKNMTGEGREVGGAFESIRWNAPELKFEETPTLASDIFSYSLVAWQIATPMHEVPFAEVDAQSASTRMATGYRPVTQGLDYRLVGLFENAWKQEPDERSTVQEIIDTLQAGGSAGGGDQWDGDGSSAKGGGANSGWKAPLLSE